MRHLHRLGKLTADLFSHGLGRQSERTTETISQIKDTCIRDKTISKVKFKLLTFKQGSSL